MKGVKTPVMRGSPKVGGGGALRWGSTGAGAPKLQEAQCAC